MLEEFHGNVDNDIRLWKSKGNLEVILFCWVNLSRTKVKQLVFPEAEQAESIDRRTPMPKLSVR